MIWFVLLHLGMFLVDLITVTRRTDRDKDDKDVEIPLLRHQLRLLQREHPRPPRLSRWEKLTLALLTAKLRHLTAGPSARQDQILLLFKPGIVPPWHRELVRRNLFSAVGAINSGQAFMSHWAIGFPNDARVPAPPPRSAPRDTEQPCQPVRREPATEPAAHCPDSAHAAAASAPLP
jgi:hypothetical protein